jgi:hypothetical protein
MARIEPIRDPEQLLDIAITENPILLTIVSVCTSTAESDEDTDWKPKCE